MLGCHGCQELMLEHLYDLLEEADKQAFLTHLDGCPECQAALQKVRGQQALLAAAARLQVADVPFVPPALQAVPQLNPVIPAVAPAPESAPATQTGSGRSRTILLPVKPRLSKPLSWQPWAIAAGVLIVVAGVGMPAYRSLREYNASEQIVQNRENAVADARKRLDDSRTQLAEAVKQRDEQIQEVEHTKKSRELRLVVSGPRAVQPALC